MNRAFKSFQQAILPIEKTSDLLLGSNFFDIVTLRDYNIEFYRDMRAEHLLAVWCLQAQTKQTEIEEKTQHFFYYRFLFLKSFTDRNVCIA